MARGQRQRKSIFTIEESFNEPNGKIYAKLYNGAKNVIPRFRRGQCQWPDRLRRSSHVMGSKNLLIFLFHIFIH